MAIALGGCLRFGFFRKPYEVSVEEFEKRAAEAPSLLSAGFVGLQKILDPATTKAVEAQEDFKEGRFDSEQAKGDGDEPGADAEDRSRSSRTDFQSVRQKHCVSGWRCVGQTFLSVHP